MMNSVRQTQTQLFFQLTAYVVPSRRIAGSFGNFFAGTVPDCSRISQIYEVEFPKVPALSGTLDNLFPTFPHQLFPQKCRNLGKPSPINLPSEMREPGKTFQSSSKPTDGATSL